jgi:hypothetical protein
MWNEKRKENEAVCNHPTHRDVNGIDSIKDLLFENN